MHGNTGQSHAFAAVLLCVRFVFAQPREQPHRCLGCGSHRCSFGPRTPAAQTDVRCAPSRVCRVVVSARMGTRGDGMRLRSCRCACDLCRCSLENSGIGAAGAAAIGAGLVHVPQLRTLTYAMCPAMYLVCGLVVSACMGTRGNGMRSLSCRCACFCIRAALPTTKWMTRVRRPLAQAWSTCLSCGH